MWRGKLGVFPVSYTHLDVYKRQVKNLFHFRKVRYKGLAKNTAQLHTLFGLANLMIAKRRLLALNGQVAP